MEQFADRFVTEDERQFSLAYLTLLQENTIDSAYAQLVPELQSPETRAQLEIVASVLSDVALDSLALVGVNVQGDAAGQRHVNLSYEATSSEGFVLANVATRIGDGVTRVEGFSARPMAESILALHAFSLEGRSFRHYFWLGMLALMFIICLGAAVLVGSSKDMPKRWLWAGLALIAAPVFVLNWTTGVWQLRPVAFVLFGAAFSSGGPSTPWIMQFGLPIGAVLALRQRQRWRRGRSPEQPLDHTAPTV
jgi:hypothetical protein